jgi:hypothetical protein
MLQGVFRGNEEEASRNGETLMDDQESDLQEDTCTYCAEPALHHCAECKRPQCDQHIGADGLCLPCAIRKVKSLGSRELQEQKDADNLALAQIAARKAGGVFLRTEEGGIMVYRCGRYGDEHRVYVTLTLTPLEKEPSKTTAPDVFYEAFSEENQ